VNRVKRITIPGGRTQFIQLLRPENLEKLSDAVYTWLRGCRYFSEATVSLVADTSKYQITTKKIESFDHGRSKQPIWVTHEDGKRLISKRIAEALQGNKMLAVKVDKTGVYLLLADKFQAFTAVTEDSSLAWLEAHPGKELPFKVGDQLLNDAWCPTIEFLPSERGQYGSGAA
jgi:hypothetical protein